jgi:poly-gamma-glutamate capsule biosynthesis protein CapA/YwtB (metallophosphatase superfamily)
MTRRTAGTALLGAGVLVAALLVLLGCSARDGTPVSPKVVGPGAAQDEADSGVSGSGESEEGTSRSADRRTPSGEVTLAFAGDMHFELQHRSLLSGGTLGPITAALRDADLAMVNLESAVATSGRPEPKKYHFRTDARAFRALQRFGVDVVTMANNHAVDYGAVGLRETLAAKRQSPVAVVGVGADKAEAFAAHRTEVGETSLSFLAASSRREKTMDNWSADEAGPGIAAARHPRPRDLIEAVEREDRRSDVVVVYLHWGNEGARCPDQKQRTTARSLVAAGADVIVGAHAHVLQGSGWLGDGYVSYGLGNFLWYHNYRSEDTGVLQVRIEDGEVVDDRWTAARAGVSGTLPRPLTGREKAEATASWEGLRGCADLAGQSD